MALSWGETGDYYVSALAGSDVTGDGSSGNPFATIQAAVNAASSGNTIVVGSGVYIETVTVTGKNLLFVGDGRVLLDGQLTQGATSGQQVSVSGFRFVTTGVALGYVAGLSQQYPNITDCQFIGCSYVFNNFRDMTATFTRCLFRGITAKVTNCSQNSINMTFARCTFRDCAAGIEIVATSGVTLSVANCIFDAITGRHINQTQASATVSLDGSNFYPLDATNDVVLKGTTYTSLAALQAAGYDTNGYSQDVSYADEAIDDYHLAPTEPLKTGASDGSYLGALRPAVMFSPNVNDALVWSNPYGTPTNMEQDGSSFWVLTNPGSGTYTSQVVDLGGDENLRRVMPVVSGLANATSLDLTTGDYWWSMEWRYQTDAQGSFLPGAGSPAWTEFVWDRDMNVSARYVQWRVTPRTDGP